MLLQTPDDVARELHRQPGVEFDLKPGQGPTIRIYASATGTISIWKPTASRPLTGLVNLTEVELGQGPYLVQRVHDTA